MIIGTIALLTVLFGGGLIDTFFVAELDKGVKEYVLDKERQQEIRADIKSTKKYIEKFNKGRKTQFKALKEMLSSITTTREDFDDLYAELHKGRLDYQGKLIDDRLALTRKIHEDEWMSIIAFSGDVLDEREGKIDKKNQKAQKNALDNPDTALKKAAKAEKEQPFFLTRQAIMDTVADTEKQTIMITSVDDMMMASQELDRQIRSVNVRNSDVIVRRDATRDEFQQIADTMNKLRRSAFEQLVQTHMIIKENTNKSQWKTIMKALNKELDLAFDRS